MYVSHSQIQYRLMIMVTLHIVYMYMYSTRNSCTHTCCMLTDRSAFIASQSLKCTHVHVHVHVQHVHVPYCPTVTPPLFATYFQEKEGGGCNYEDLHFRLSVNPPPPPPRIRVLRSTKLCCAVEDENSFDRHAVAVLKELLTTYILHSR